MEDPLESLPDPSVARARSSRWSRSKGGSVPRDWYPPRSVERQWQSIVIHHSATPNGNMAIFDKWHRETNHWEGVGYDFVIGNGLDSPDGLVEVTFRWHEQITGAHCKTPGNWANENAVGICLVGNFDESVPSDAQMRSLTRLVKYLSERYRIPAHQIYGHNSTPGARVTNCPGRHFGMTSVHAMLSK
ncbi:MAG: N-acetylmuramoyl-L-alanine amidase [Planctomycetes bacterium]|nr:N-acetylmuramoyl-L-alanine amidase [Planctomycetota bacterium]